MATAYKVLGQSAPAATTATALYTVPSSTEAIISTIVVANRAAAARSYRIAIRPDGASLANQHYLAYDVAIAANDSTALTLGITVDAADVVEVYASAADLSFTAFGSELS
jgi:glucose-6-phosphate dehydrogenase assembly protein OpcA